MNTAIREWFNISSKDSENSFLNEYPCYQYKTYLDFILGIDANKSLGARLRAEFSQARTKTQCTFVDLRRKEVHLF